MLTLVISAITFLPTQQQQRRTETERKNIEKDRSHYEAWAIINNNRVDIKGNLIKANSGRTTALQNLNRDRVPLQRIELPETFLSGIDLSGADLYRADFRGADLYQAKFNSLPIQVNPTLCDPFIDCKSQEEIKERRTDLQRTNFSGAILYGVNFNAPKLNDSETNKKLGVNLFRADFRPFYIRKFSSNEDKISQQCIKNATSTECLITIECGMVRDPIIQCVRAVNATFIGANLKAVDFTKADLKGSNFEDSDLECATFRGAIFNQVKRIDSIDLPEGIPPTNFKKANIRGVDFRDVIDLSPTQVEQAVNWREAIYSASFAAKLGLSPQNKPFDCKGQRYIQEPIRYPS
ncbi:pentapeptide repeat-containing protein [Chamaesiphon sp. OTE_75_metabat_556]|uniref:pentapeptide repeat-containing protein n=1 Tax=Chamaesiphon sp. OTE_75_metabat_556 TaxID=2964692 RepID=UPI00286CCF69|nr:pentapeptide repeat-containing protein [Chamaesiphon sp. OTE_75_metabat_556]